MATTGSSSSAVMDEGAQSTPAPLDLMVGLVARQAPTIDVVAFVREVTTTLMGHGSALRWQAAVAHSDASSPEVGRLRDTLGASGHLVEVPYSLQPSDALSVPFHGLPGRARALHAILREAHARGARACMILDPHTTTPYGWLEHLVQPVLMGEADCVMPVYRRHPFSGALIHGVVYPAFRALYGARLRYPLASDASYSRALIEAVLPEPIWDTAAGQLGIDLWLSATAVSNSFRVAQATLGARIDEPSSVDASTAVSQVVGALFTDMEPRAASWQRTRETRMLPQFGGPSTLPDPPDIDAGQLVDSFRLGSRELQDVWAEVLPPLAMLQWRRLASSTIDAFRVDDVLWARTVYDFAAGHRQRVIAREHLLPSFTPLYLGWLASFVLEVRNTSLEDAEARIERLCVAFEREKPYLISQWRWPERFKPVKRRR